MTKKVRLGIIGLGQQGGAYAKFIADGMVPNMEIGAICDIDPAKKELASATYPDAPFYDDYIAMLESGDVDAVVTCVPHFLHPEMGIETLKRNIHALVEKPAGVYTKQVKELNEFAAGKPELSFAIMFNQRNNPLYRKLKEIVENGEIGKHPPQQLDHHQLVASAGLLQLQRMARHVGRRGRRRAGQPGTAPAGPVAVDLRRAEVRLLQGCLWLPPRHRRRGRSHRGG